MQTFRPYLLVLGVFGLVWAGVSSAAESRNALVMGVWAYTDPTFPALPGIQEDVKGMSDKLKQLGFDVTTVVNPSLGQAKTAVDTFSATLKTRGGVGLFYFSGHGCENEGKNYLIPRGTRISRRADLDDEALSAQRVLNGMEDSGARVNVVFLDCCRNGLTKGAGGLAAMQANGTFIGFATASTHEANAGQTGSVYTQALINRMGTAGMSIMDMHTLVTRDVKQITAAAGSPQIPFQYSGLDSVFELVPKEENVTLNPLRINPFTLPAPSRPIFAPPLSPAPIQPQTATSNLSIVPFAPFHAPLPLPGTPLQPVHGISPGMVFGGTFSYGKSYIGNLAPVQFSLRIESVDAAGNFTGVTSEPFTGFGVSTDGRLYAEVKGRITATNPGAVNFSYRKTYRGFLHPGASYMGTYSPNKKSLFGVWSLKDPDTNFQGGGDFTLQLQILKQRPMNRRSFFLRSLAAGSAPLLAPAAPGGLETRKVVISGFEPFQGRKVNASSRLAGYLGALLNTRWDVSVIEIPVVWDEPLKAVEAHWPGPGGLWLAFGEGTPGAIRIETLAVNRRSSTPDNRHALPPLDQIDPAGPDEFEQDFPAAPLLEKIQAAGFSARLSRDAGGYLCGELLYDLLRKQHKTRKKEVPVTALFIHVPPWDSRITSGETEHSAHADEAYFRRLATVLVEALEK